MPDSDVVIKLRDAANQMILALATRDEEILRSCINSYISSARSVTMVLERESKHIGMLDWYKQQMKTFGNAPLFRFFNAQRVHSIHKGSIKPVKKSHKVLSVSYWYVVDKYGKNKLEGTTEIEAEVPSVNARDIVSHSEDGMLYAWCFSEIEDFMPGDTGNVFRLCEDYYLLLKWLIEEWFREQYRRGIR